MFRKILVGFLLLVIFSQSAERVWADEYLFDVGNNGSLAKAQVVPAPHVGKYIYGILGAGHDTVDFYSLTFADFASQVVFELLTPDRGGGSVFHPSMVVLDPSFRQVVGGPLPFGFPTNIGGRVFAWPKTGEKLVTDKEAFMTLYLGPQLVKDVSPTRYIVAVFDPDGRGGRYVLHVGRPQSSSSLLSVLTRLPAILRLKLDLY